MNECKLEDFIFRIANGEEDALRELYSEYCSAVFLLALSILRHREQAEDVMQNVFLKIWAGAGSYRKGRSARAWIMGITHHEAVDSLRKSSREKALDSDDTEAWPAAQGQMEDDVQSRLDMEKALSSLNKKERQAVVMRALGGLTYSEMAGILSIPLPTAAWRYKNGLRKLGEHLSVLQEAAL